MSAIDHDALEAAIRADRDVGTPGEWRSSDIEPGWICEQSGFIIAMMPGDNDPGDSEFAPTCEPDVCDANERRIARTPDLEFAYLASREEARQLRAERDRLREALRNVCAWYGAVDAVAPELGGLLKAMWAGRTVLWPGCDQRDPGDETPDDDGFIAVHPRRDGPGLDVKALACVADHEGRN